MRIAAVAVTLAGLASGQPVITRVEPPNWWTKTTASPVRLLIRGEGLGGAAVTSDLKTSAVKTNSNGTYLFVNVAIARGAKAGSHPLKIETPEGSASAPFELLEPLPPQGRFRGFDNSDFIYLLMPDRFVNGDRSNDDPSVSPGLFDPRAVRVFLFLHAQQLMARSLPRHIR
jgi:hypothetical protein